MREWKLYVINHSHTDLGYTDRQEKIARYHVDFVRQAVDLLNEIHSGAKESCKGYKWQCENFWQVKNFYAHANKQEISDFEKYVKTGEIGLSGTYLNLTDLVDHETLVSRLAEGQKFARKIGIAVDCGMCADVNGFPGGFPDDLYEHGIRNFYSALHPHHGMFPIYRKTMPFFWEGPKGHKVLCWNGEHYHFGNELFLAPFGGNSYTCLDEFHKGFLDNIYFCKNRTTTLRNELRIGKIRIERYLANLEEEGYPYDFIPVLVSGGLTDNGFPSGHIAERLAQYDEIFSGKISFQMATLPEFFARLRDCDVPIATYRGDWTDWWADGIGSTPAGVKLVRSAQRKLRLCKLLDPDQKEGSSQLLEEARENIMLYSEHTWGYSSSVSEPWDTLVNALGARKNAYATSADVAISKNLDLLLAKRGEVSIRADRPQHYTVINPSHRRMKLPAVFSVEKWEYINGVRIDESTPLIVVDEKNLKRVPCQRVEGARDYKVYISPVLDPEEERNYTIRIDPAPARYVVKNHPYIGADRIQDILPSSGYENSTRQVETDYFVAQFSRKDGLVKLVEKKTGRNIIRPDAEYPAFSGIYELTDMHGSPIETRRKMGRNRKSEATVRYRATVKDISVEESGDVFTRVRIDYSLPGTKMYAVILTFFKDAPLIDVSVRIHKTTVWDPENLYLSLPFFAGEEEEVYIDKTSSIMRPGIDQLPGSNQDFYLVQNGIVFAGDVSLMITLPDSPLVKFGSLEPGPITLCSGMNADLNKSPVFCWLMNNYWETNFNVNLAGFYEFSFSLSISSERRVDALFEQCRSLSTGFVAFNSEEGKENG